ncbi:4-alpha-glucanotransferase [candidate division WOR-3 bacterium]|nr:4-alpha-glucanotransferase [candidate division WOR-3 bacterium]
MERNRACPCPVFEKRGSGILMHVTSLPSPYGIGDLGPEAYNFVDFLVRARQRYWQVLPLIQANYRGEYSPYNCMSAFADNKYLISPDMLLRTGLLKKSELGRAPGFPRRRVNFGKAIRFKEGIFRIAHERFGRTGHTSESYMRFCAENSVWLDDFALFTVLNDQDPVHTWLAWPAAVRRRDRRILQSLRNALRKDIERERFLQYIFFSQWQALRNYCNERHVGVIGDLPIYVDHNSADVWSHPELFKLDRGLRPLYLSGVPPDYFSRDGQLWGNPVYDWREMRRTGFRWWRQRFASAMELYDYVRLDHFRGFVAYWQVRAGARTARRGKWVKAPAADLLTMLRRQSRRLPLIAEDLGTITPDVREVMARFGLPGMKVLLFAFGDGDPDNPYLPHNHVENCVVYTGTHDNNTVRGWYEEEATDAEKHRLHAYLGRRVSTRRVHEEFVRLAMSSVAETVIIPMQDILGLGGRARMNRPATTTRNWQWRLMHGSITPSVIGWLRSMTESYGRCG